jgi:hypothetical protein
MILLLAGWFLRERITATLVVLTIVAVGGMVVILTTRLAAVARSSGWLSRSLASRAAPSTPSSHAG